MIDWTPENSQPPAPEARNLFFAWLGTPEDFTQSQARRDFNIELVEMWLPPTWSLKHLERLKKCFGVLVYGMDEIPEGFAQVCDYFFARDRGEALVYTWLPFERRFRMVDQGWVDLRRRRS